MNKILIVDDEEKVRKLVEITLSISKVEVLQASSGEECLKIARETKPDIILLDVMMPGRFDGFDVCKLLKEDLLQEIFISSCLRLKDKKPTKKKGSHHLLMIIL
ncbi:MAG: response regulator [Desulfobacterales bacterium]|nr:response regulator [Desulfobacterales bacterium]